MRRVGIRVGIVVWVVLLGAGGGAAAEEEGPVVLDLKWVSGSPARYYEHVVEFQYDGGSALPLTIPFGPGATLLLARGPGEGVPSLLVDCDFDGDLSDERRVDFEFAFDLDNVWSVRRGEELRLTYHGAVWVHPPWAEEQGLDEGVHLYVSGSSEDGERKIHLAALLHRKGRVVLGGRARLVVVYDGNGDLAFDDPTEDRVFLDLDGDCTIPRDASSPERIVPGRPFCVRGEGYVATIEEPQARRVTFTRCSEVPPPSWHGVRESGPPAGVEQIGEARSLEEITREYAAKKGNIKRKRATPVVLVILVAEAGHLGTPEAFAFLERVYREHPSPVLRVSVVQAMGDVRYAHAAPKLLRIAARARDRSVCLGAIEALHRMGAPGREKTLIEMARKTKDTGVFRSAVRHAAYTGTPRARQALTALFGRLARQRDRAYEVYCAATRFFSDPPSEALIRHALRSGGPRLQGLALRDALALPYPVARDLALARRKEAKGARAMRAAVIEILGMASDAPSVRALLDLVGDVSETGRDRMVELLRPVRDGPATKILLDALSSRDPTVRLLAADTVGGLCDPAIPETLAERLAKEPEADVRLALVRAVGEQDATEAIPALLRILRGTKIDPDFEAIAIDVLLAIGFDDVEVVTHLEGLLRSGAWESRLRLVDGAVASGLPQAVRILIPGLEDEKWQVRLVAAQGLGRIRSREAVPVLIERLAVEEKPRVRNAVAHALYRITGVNLYDVTDVWRQWWAQHGDAFEIPEEVADLPETDPGRVYGTFYGIPVDSECVVFVIDESGSMDTEHRGSDGQGTGKTETERAIEETLEVVARLPDRARVNVILFASDVLSWRSGLSALQGDTREELAEFLRTKRLSGGTNLYDALAKAVRTPDVDAIYLLSDGMPSSGRYTDDDDILRAIGEMNWTRRAAIHCVALGWDSDLLRSLAEQNGGTYVRR